MKPEVSNLDAVQPYGDIPNQGKKGSKSYTIDSTRDLPMFYLTFVSSSPPASKSSSDTIIDLNAKKSSPNKNGNKRNNKTTDDGGGGTMFQCQELDGGNAIECKSFYFDADANISRIRLIAIDFEWYFIVQIFSVIYPFLHIAPDPQEMLQIGSIPSSVIADYEIQSMLKGLYWYIYTNSYQWIFSI